MNPCYVLLASRPWFAGIVKSLEQATGCTFHFIQCKEELANLDLLALQPRYIFVPHWSWVIPEDIWSQYETVIFHMTDLPFGRGGSPLQNIILQNMEETKITALRCEKEIDAGPIYLKKSLSLHGSAQEIFERTVPIVEEMILHIIKHEPTPVIQSGKPTYFKRRTPLESNIENLNDIKKIYDYIRMLDAKGYPHAFLEHEDLHLEFTEACLEDGKIIAKVNITLKDKNHA